MKPEASKIMSILSIGCTKHTPYPMNLISLLAISFILLMVILAYCLPCILALDPNSTSEHLLYPPGVMFSDGKHYFLGTDDLGRDVLSRLVFGARNTLSIGFFVVILSLVVGSMLGFLASVYGGFLHFSIGYFNDLMMSFPSILLTILLLALLGPGIITTVIAVTIVAIPGFIRVTSTVATEEMKKDYITAAHSFGLSRFKILSSELFPNCIAAIMVQATFAFSDAILTVSLLGFLRLGVSPPMAEWGSMLADAYQLMESSPYLVIFPGLCIFFTVLAANLLGDQLLDQRGR